jgi:hypothetical protein
MQKKTFDIKCESCVINEFQVEEFIKGEQNPYRLCKSCHERLLNYALRPLEFFNLVSIHGHTYYLHDDFYDYDTGEATQPKIDVINADSFPFPELENIKTNVKKLVDYACVQYFTSDNVVELLKNNDKETILNYLDCKVNYNRAINYKAYEIAAKVLNLTASQWISKEWESRKENELLVFAEAICKCLPFEEAFQILTSEIETTDEKYFTDNSSALIYLQSSKTLDWIEKISNRITNVSTSWGTLAAASQFSWDRAEKWLKIGRPLSLIALDGLILCTTSWDRQNQAIWFRENPPSLVNPAKSEIIANTVTSYLERDKVPRTKNAVGQIIQNLFTAQPD